MMKVVGHRGSAGVLPENTLAGFRYAIELGVDAVECDVHLTRDGHLVVIHDATADRTTDGAGRIAEMNLAEVRALDAGGGQRVPTFEEVLALVAGRCGLLCELKADGTEAPAVEAVRARGMEADVMFISFNLERLANVKRLDGRLAVGALFAAADDEEIARAADVGARHLGVHYRHIYMDMVPRVRGAGMELGAWTPNELKDMQLLMEMGVDCLTTDRPDILMGYLKESRS